MNGADFYVGDLVEVLCDDGARFEGELMFIHPDYVVVNGLGFALGSIRLEHLY